MTNQYVSKTGKVGLALLANKLIQPIQPIQPKAKQVQVKKDKIPIISYGCKKIGMTQTMATCWFNSICNNLLLSQNCYSYFMHQYNALSADEKQAIENFDDNTCPLKIKKHHFYRFVYLYNKAQSTPINILSKMYRLYKTRNHAKNLINKLEIREHGWESPKNQRFDTYEALTRILPIVFNANEYVIKMPHQKQVLLQS